MTSKVKVKFHHVQSHPRKYQDAPETQIWCPGGHFTYVFLAISRLRNVRIAYFIRIVYAFLSFLSLVIAKKTYVKCPPSSILSNVIERTSPFCPKMDFFAPKWPWRSRSNLAIYDPIREHVKMHIKNKFGGSSSIPSKVIVRTSPFLSQDGPFCPEITLKVKVTWNFTIYYPIREHVKMNLKIKFGGSSSIPSKVTVRTSPFLSQDGLFCPEMTLKVKVKFHHIQSHPRTYQDAPKNQIWWL